MKKEKNYGLIIVAVILGLFVMACLVSVINEMYIAGPYEDAAMSLWVDGCLSIVSWL
jgi:hypothetical protein